VTFEKTMETKLVQRYFVSSLGHQHVVLGIERGTSLRFGTKQELDEFIKLLQHAWERCEKMVAK
jgi:hypothetical protein